jgi:hypothetical protein
VLYVIACLATIFNHASDIDGNTEDKIQNGNKINNIKRIPIKNAINAFIFNNK